MTLTPRAGFDWLVVGLGNPHRWVAVATRHRVRVAQVLSAMTGATAWPFVYTLGPRSTLDAKRDWLRRFADEVIAKVG
jgi:hypothetical protein